MWIDDGEILKAGEWEPGMGVQAIRYCVDEAEIFLSMQVIVGNEDVRIPLQKHGGPGGTCMEWRLVVDDYITKVQYTWN